MENKSILNPLNPAFKAPDSFQTTIAAYVAYLRGAPIDLTLLAGLLNGTVLPMMPTIALLAEQKPAIVGDGFHMNSLLKAAGIPVALAASFACILNLVALIHLSLIHI